MMLKLSDSERMAIDVVLDRAAGWSPSGLPAVANAGAVDTSAIQRVLKLLATLSAQEPAADLTARTMARIEQSSIAPIQAPSFIAALSAQPAQ